MWTWLMVKLGVALRWRLERKDLKWTLVLWDTSPEMLGETVRQISVMLNEGWSVVEQPSKNGVPLFHISDAAVVDFKVRETR